MANIYAIPGRNLCYKYVGRYGPEIRRPAARNDRERIRMVKDMYPGELKEYTEDEERKWIDEALEYDQDEKEVFAKEGFENTHWYKFQLAAKKQLGTVVNILADIM